MVKLNESQRVRLLKIVNDFRLTRDPALQSVMDEAISYLERGEVNDRYTARYVRDALFFNEEVKEKNNDLVEMIESNFFCLNNLLLDLIPRITLLFTRMNYE